MKKKLVLVVAVMLVAITACGMLVGCIPDRPDRFILAWLDPNNTKKAIQIGEAEYGISGDKMIMKALDGLQTIYEKKGNEYRVYTCVGGKWSAAVLTVEEAEKEDAFVTIEATFNQEKLDEAYKKYTENFEENFKKDDEGWWTWNKDALGIVKMKVEKNSIMTIRTAGLIDTKMLLNYKIDIPDGAKEALKALKA